MKLSSIALISSIAVSTHAFIDTSPIILDINKSLTKLSKLPYLSSSSKISNEIEAISDKICSDSSNALIMYQIPGFGKQDSLDFSSEHSLYSPNVRYHKEQVELKLSEKCSVKDVVVENVEDFEYINQLTINDKVVRVKISEDLPMDQIKQNLDQLKTIVSSLYDNQVNVIVQGLPTFKKISLDSLKGSLWKRDDSLIDETDFEQLLEEVEQDFQDVEDYLSVSGDEIISIMDTPSNVQGNFTVKNPNLFTNYQFFTPGIWMGTIVSLLLVWFFSIAISWITSLQVSYKSFDKQVDYSKKNQ